MAEFEAWIMRMIVDEHMDRRLVARLISVCVNNAVNRHCSCGGCGPGDPKACQACQVYWDIELDPTHPEVSK